MDLPEDPRIKQIAQLILDGKTNEEIQKEMHISPKDRTLLIRIAQRRYVLPSASERMGRRSAQLWQDRGYREMMSQKLREAAKPGSRLSQIRRENALAQNKRRREERSRDKR